jgi:hypothetical protein
VLNDDFNECETLTKLMKFPRTQPPEYFVRNAFLLKKNKNLSLRTQHRQEEPSPVGKTKNEKNVLRDGMEGVKNTLNKSTKMLQQNTDNFNKKIQKNTENLNKKFKEGTNSIVKGIIPSHGADVKVQQLLLQQSQIGTQMETIISILQKEFLLSSEERNEEDAMLAIAELKHVFVNSFLISQIKDILKYQLPFDQSQFRISLDKKPGKIEVNLDYDVSPNSGNIQE